MVDARRGGIGVTHWVARLATLTLAAPFVACVDGSSDAPLKPADAASLCVLMLDGGFKRVDAEAAGHHAVAWSPDGTRLAYGVSPKSATDVCIATLVSDEIRTVGSTAVSTRAATT